LWRKFLTLFVLSLLLFCSLSVLLSAASYEMSEETRTELISYIRTQKDELQAVKKQLANSEINLKEADQRLAIVEMQLSEADQKLATVSGELTEVSNLMRELKESLKALQKEIRWLKIKAWLYGLGGLIIGLAL
jgi:peptidoglycan hydrolase CwlO-like protein